MKKTGPDEWGGGLGGSPPVSGRESENCFKNAWKCVKFQKIFSCGACQHRRRHQSFSIIKAKFFNFCGDEHKICHFSRFFTKILALSPPDVKGYVRHCCPCQKFLLSYAAANRRAEQSRYNSTSATLHSRKSSA